MHVWQNVLAWAADTPAATPAGNQQAQPPNIMLMVIMGLGIFAAYQLLLGGPKNKAEQKKREEALNSLGKGDLVLTSSGIHGTVESIEKDKGIVNVSVAPKVTMRFSRDSIASYTKKDKGGSEEASA